MGTPNTGTIVFAASMPGKCAAPPAPAIIAFNPFFSAFSAYENNKSGVRCAEIIFISYGIDNDFKIISAAFIVSQSDFEPITILIIFIHSFYSMFIYFLVSA